MPVLLRAPRLAGARLELHREPCPYPAEPHRRVHGRPGHAPLRRGAPRRLPRHARGAPAARRRHDRLRRDVRRDRGERLPRALHAGLRQPGRHAEGARHAGETGGNGSTRMKYLWNGARGLCLVFSWMLAIAAHAQEPDNLRRAKVPAPPWPAGDERGMATQIGPATQLRCAWHMQQPGARPYELSYVRSNTMPASPFAAPTQSKPKATAGIPGTAHAFNSEQWNENAEPAQQGTQMDALGHFAYFRQPWDGKSEFPAEAALYYGGYTDKDVKPTSDWQVVKLGIEQMR